MVTRTSGSCVQHWIAHRPVLPPTSSSVFGRRSNTIGSACGNAESE
jgi:hypothetical protein